MKLVVLISGNGSNLQAIIDAVNQGTIKASIAAVIADRAGCYGLQRASQNNIPTQVLAYKQFPSRADFCQELAQIVQSYQPELIVLAGFMRILSPEFVSKFQHKIINLHPSLLPKYPGRNTHQQVCTNQDPYHGTTIHIVTDQLDAGPIIAQAKFKVQNYDPKMLEQQVKQLEHQLYPQIISEIAAGTIKLSSIDQHSSFATVTYEI